MSKTKPENPPTPAAAAESAPAKRSAMKLPPGVAPKSAQGSQGRHNWTHGPDGKAQTDFARRAGKSRKVH